MKQRISKEQILEIENNQIKELLIRWKPDLGDWIYNKYYDDIGIICGLDDSMTLLNIIWYDGGESDLTFGKNTLPLVNIGQMTKMLNNYHSCLKIEIDTEGFFTKVKGGVSNIKMSDNLCDSLWEALKQTL